METCRVGHFATAIELAVWLAKQNADGFLFRGLASQNGTLVCVVSKPQGG